MPMLANISILRGMHVDRFLAVVERNIPPEMILQLIRAIILTRSQNMIFSQHIIFYTWHLQYNLKLLK